VKKRPPSEAQLEKQAAIWNQLTPVGSDVRYHPVIGWPEYRVRKTRSEAFVLSGHTACVFLVDESGCVALDACEPVRGNG
jgi:hypothetical protein